MPIIELAAGWAIGAAKKLPTRVWDMGSDMLIKSLIEKGFRLGQDKLSPTIVTRSDSLVWNPSMPPLRTFESPSLLIGSDPASDICIPGLPSRAAIIYRYNDTNFGLQSFDSRVDVILNNQRWRGDSLAFGDRLTIGRAEMVLDHQWVESPEHGPDLGTRRQPESHDKPKIILPTSGRGENPKQDLAAERRARQIVATAQTEADKIISDARVQAEHIRSEAERELAALMQRRDSINAQLHNVRELLATLTGGKLGGALAGLKLDEES
jgi:hypothetical protein